MAYDSYEQAVMEMNQRYKYHSARLREIWDVPEETEEAPKMVNFDYVKKCRELYNDYLAARKKHNDGFDELKRNFIGKELETRTAEHRTSEPDANKVIASINAHTKIYLDHLATLEASAMDSKNLTSDFELLRLPVTLTSEELQSLHNRNCDNPLFCRALREYFAKNEDKYDIGVVLDLRDGVTVRREIVEDIAKELEQQIRFPDFNGFAEVGTEMLLDMYEERLSGNGLFKPPQVIEPKDGEEPAEPDASTPDAFVQGFKDNKHGEEPAEPETPSPEPDSFTQGFAGGMQ